MLPLGKRPHRITLAATMVDDFKKETLTKHTLYLAFSR
jgi:hypothetical protein